MAPLSAIVAAFAAAQASAFVLNPNAGIRSSVKLYIGGGTPHVTPPHLVGQGGPSAPTPPSPPGGVTPPSYPGSVSPPGGVTPPHLVGQPSAPPAVTPPSVSAPSYAPPSVTPPGGVTPPSVSAPSYAPPSVTPPGGVTPPAAVTPPSYAPPSVTPPGGVTPPSAPSPPPMATTSNPTPSNTITEIDHSGDPNSKNFRKLSDALAEADIERRKAEEEALKRENAAMERKKERERKIQHLRDTPDNTPAGNVQDFMYKEGVKEILEKLDSDLIGLLPVKARVREIAALLVVDKMRYKLGFDTAVPSLHMCFTGAPGTGKTTVAIRMGQILQRMGYCRQGHVVVATRDDLVGQYVGHTAPKTKEVIKKSLGGVLLIDEAYYLYNAGNDRDYGQESIEILLNVMENQKEDLVCVLAGYKDRMEQFFSYIPGMNSRVGNHIDFPNYEKDELVSIAKVMARDLEYQFAPGADGIFQTYIDERMRRPFFSNARTVRNAMDRARMNAAIRVFKDAMATGDGTVDENDLSLIDGRDFQVLVDEIMAADEKAILA